MLSLQFIFQLSQRLSLVLLLTFNLLFEALLQEFHLRLMIDLSLCGLILSNLLISGDLLLQPLDLSLMLSLQVCDCLRVTLFQL